MRRKNRQKPSSDVTDHLPSSPEAEQGLLGAFLLSPGLLEEADGLLKAEDFYDPKHQKIYRALLEVYREKKTADLVLVCEHLRQSEALEQAGGELYLAELQGSVPSAFEAPHYLEVVQEKSRRRKLLRACQEVLASSQTGSELSELGLKVGTALEEISAPHSERSTPLLEHRGALYLKTPDGARRISNFVLRPLEILELPGEEEILKVEATTEKGKSYVLRIPRSAFNGRLPFLTALRRMELQFFGHDREVMLLLGYLTRRTLPTRQGTRTIGLWKSEDGKALLWVTPQRVIGPEGALSDPPLEYVPSGNPLERHLSLETASAEKWQDLLQALCRHLTWLHKPSVLWPILGFFHAAPYRMALREEHLPFPILQLHGSQGGGKTSLALFFARLFGYRRWEAFSIRTSDFVLLRLLSGTNGVPLVFDEYKADAGQGALSRFRHLIRSAYHGVLEARGKADQSVIDYELVAPLVICGEATLLVERALAERVVAVHLDPHYWLTAEGKRSQEAYRELGRLPLHLYAERYFSFVLRRIGGGSPGHSWRRALEQARYLVKWNAGNLSSERISHNLAVVVFGIHEFYQFLAEEGISVEPVPQLKEIVPAMLGELGPGSDGGKIRMDFDAVLEELSALAQRQLLKPGVHYRLEGKRLYLHLPSCLQELAGEASSRGWLPDRRDLRRQAREICQGGGYVRELDAVVRFSEGRLVRATVVDLEKLSEAGVVIDGFHADGRGIPVQNNTEGSCAGAAP